MTAMDEARAHWDKAREFLEAAEMTRDMNLHNAATSDAVVSGINSKDTICLVLVGRSRKADRHDEAVAELRAAGPSHPRTPPEQSSGLDDCLWELRTSSQTAERFCRSQAPLTSDFLSGA